MAKPKAKRKPPVKAKSRAKKKGGARQVSPEKLAGIGAFAPKADLLSLTRSLGSRQTEMDEIRGSMGNAVALAVRKNHIHKAALADYRRYAKLSDPELARRLKHFLHYVEVGGLTERADQQIEAFSIAEMNGVKGSEATPLEGAIAKTKTPRKAAAPKMEAPADVPAALPPEVPEGERPAIQYN